MQGLCNFQLLSFVNCSMYSSSACSDTVDPPSSPDADELEVSVRV